MINNFLKITVILSLFAISCSGTSKPLLEEGSCYSVEVYGTVEPGSIHELSNFKIVKIFDFENEKHYAIQMIRYNDKIDLVPLYPKTKSLGYARVNEFDKYISPLVGKFSHPEGVKKTINCNPITDKEREEGAKSPRQPIMRVGKDLDGIRE